MRCSEDRCVCKRNHCRSDPVQVQSTHVFVANNCKKKQMKIYMQFLLSTKPRAAATCTRRDLKLPQRLTPPQGRARFFVEVQASRFQLFFASDFAKMTTVGFEPMPLRTKTWRQNTCYEAPRYCLTPSLAQVFLSSHRQESRPYHVNPQR